MILHSTRVYRSEDSQRFVRSRSKANRITLHVYVQVWLLHESLDSSKISRYPLHRAIRTFLVERALWGINVFLHRGTYVVIIRGHSFVNSSVEQRRRRRRQRWRREEQWKKNEMRWSVWSRVRAQCNRITDLDHLTSPSGIEERRFRERTRSHDYIPPFSTLFGIFIAIIHIIHTAFFSDLPIQGGRQRQTTSVILSGDVFSRSRFENSLRVAIVLRDLLLELKSTNLFGLTRSKGRWNVPRRKRSVSRKLRF